MKFRPIKKFQDGGEIDQETPEMTSEEQPMQEEAAQQPQQGGGDPLIQLAQLAMQALQGQDCNAAMQVCQAFLQLIQQAQQQQGAAPQQGEPVFRKGGILIKRK